MWQMRIADVGAVRTQKRPIVPALNRRRRSAGNRYHARVTSHGLRAVGLPLGLQILNLPRPSVSSPHAR